MLALRQTGPEIRDQSSGSETGVAVRGHLDRGGMTLVGTRFWLNRGPHSAQVLAERGHSKGFALPTRRSGAKFGRKRARARGCLSVTRKTTRRRPGPVTRKGLHVGDAQGAGPKEAQEAQGRIAQGRLGYLGRAGRRSTKLHSTKP